MGINQIRDHIYVNTEYDGTNVACINTDDGMVLVDTPMLPKDIAHWQEFINRINQKEIAYIIATHHHFDHIIGNKTFGGRVIMHEVAKDEMFEKDGTLRESMAAGAPGRTKEEVDFILSQPLVSPEITFEDEMSLYMGSVKFRLSHVGGHTVGSICVYLEDEKILLTGDNLTAGLHPYKGHANFKDWIEALKWMKCLDVDLIIPGHGEVCEVGELDRFIEYFHTLWFMTEDLIKKGIGKSQVIAEVREKMFGFFDVDPESLEASQMMFDMGTDQLYMEIILSE